MEQSEDVEKSVIEKGVHVEDSLVKKRGYTEKEAAVYLAVSRSFLRQGRMNGVRKNRTPAPDFVRKGRNIKYLKETLDKWLEEYQWVEKVEDNIIKSLENDQV